MLLAGGPVGPNLVIEKRTRCYFSSCYSPSDIATCSFKLFILAEMFNFLFGSLVYDLHSKAITALIQFSNHLYLRWSVL